MAKKLVRVKLEIKNLNVDCIDESPSTMDWSEIFEKESEDTRVYEAATCNGCEKYLVTLGPGTFEHQDCAEYMGLDDSDRGEGELCRGQVYTDGPLMNAFWPLPNSIFSTRWNAQDPKIAALKIRHLPLCIVETEAFGVGFALTGGGMDMSWYIAEGYMRLGFCPPICLRLPRMAGYPRSPKHRWVVKGCLRSAKVARTWADHKIEDLRKLLKEKNDD